MNAAPMDLHTSHLLRMCLLCSVLNVKSLWLVSTQRQGLFLRVAAGVARSDSRGSDV